MHRLSTGTWLAQCALTACVFVPPPLLPEEIAAAAAAKAAQGSASPSGPAEQGQTPSENSESYSFQPGDPPMVGMSAAGVKAYALSQGDPEAGEFTLEEALVGLASNEEGALWAEIVTPRGVLRCELYETTAPLTVANFVGLARGLRPVRGGTEWSKKPWYDGTTFHRVIPGFMIQGGDPTGTGTGNPGYVIVDEIRPEIRHDRAGVLSMANRGASTSGAQFFITLAPTPELDGAYTIFGACDAATAAIADTISAVPRDENDKPDEPEKIETIRIVRK